MPRRGTESEFELTTIDRLELQGYEYCHGIELDRSKDEVVLRDRLRSSLTTRYSDLPDEAIDDAVRQFARPEGVDTIRRNLAFQKSLRSGIELPYEHSDGTTQYEHVYAIDWKTPETNDFLVVNQLSVQGKNDRRPDLVVYVNGLPLVLFELKSPFDQYTTVDGAFNQSPALRARHPATLRLQRLRRDFPTESKPSTASGPHRGSTSIRGSPSTESTSKPRRREP